MRLDYFLKISRLVKRRPLAKEMCDKHLVYVNDQVAKAGKIIEAEDIISVKLPQRTVKVRVEHVPERAVSKNDAATLYTMLEDVREKEADML
ncbi:MAG: RNA-binding S4 domain-containing protein [Candidatus Vecturithrix sp.]|jgi:ribosomal 50S subunit-recycling heat shock protein|nr:RNA-binding S4 domain-containing protein [Candidatus Vecturithrix sp.]